MCVCVSVSLPPLRIVPGGEQIISSGMSLVCSRGFHQNLIRESLINLPFLFFVWGGRQVPRQQTMITRVLAPGSLFICSFIIFPFLDMVSMRSCSSCNFLLIYLYRHQKEKERLTAAARLLFHYLLLFYFLGFL